MHSSAPAAAEGKGSGNADGSHSIQPVRILHALPFQRCGRSRMLAVRNLRNYCAHNSMLVGMTSSVVLMDSNDDATLLQADNDLFSRIYALKKLIPIDDTDNMKKDIKKLINKTPVDILLLGILPRNWEDIYDKIVEF